MNINELKACVTRWFNLDQMGLPSGRSDAEYDEALAEIRAAEPGWIPTLFKNGDDIRHPMAYRAPSSKNGNLSAYRSASLDSTPKLDGCSVSCYYHRGVRKFAATRSNEFVGKLKPNLEKLFPKTAPAELLRIDAELVVSYDKTTRPRQAANGIVNSNDNAGEFVLVAFEAIYDSSYDVENVFSRDRVRHALCKDSHSIEIIPTLSRPQESKVLESKKVEINGKFYPIDGLVGYGTGYGFMIYKIPYGDRGETTITGHHWKLSPHHVWVPTALYEPINLGGSNCKRAACNVNLIQRGYKKGAIVIVEMAGSTIPHLGEIIEQSTEPDDGLLKCCPKCYTPLSKDRAKLYCTNSGCSTLPDMKGWTMEKLVSYLKARISYLKNWARIADGDPRGKNFGGKYQNDQVVRFWTAWKLQNDEINETEVA